MGTWAGQNGLRRDGSGRDGEDLPDDHDPADDAPTRCERLDTLVSELDQRRHVVTRMARAIRHHRGWAAAVIVLGLGAIGAAVQLALRHHRKQQTLRSRLGRWSHAFARMVRRPEQVARSQPTLAEKVLGAAASSLTSTVVKRAGARALPDRRS